MKESETHFLATSTLNLPQARIISRCSPSKGNLKGNRIASKSILPLGDFLISRGTNSVMPAETPGRLYLNPVVKVTTTRDETQHQHPGDPQHSCGVPAQNLSLTMRKPHTKNPHWAPFCKITSVYLSNINAERCKNWLRNPPRLKDTKEIDELNAQMDPGFSVAIKSNWKNQNKVF